MIYAINFKAGIGKPVSKYAVTDCKMFSCCSKNSSPEPEDDKDLDDDKDDDEPEPIVEPPRVVVAPEPPVRQPEGKELNQVHSDSYVGHQILPLVEDSAKGPYTTNHSY